MKRAAFGILILVLMTLTACGKDKMTAEGENEKGLAYYNSGDYETARDRLRTVMIAAAIA